MTEHAANPSGASAKPSKAHPDCADVRTQLDRLVSSASLRLSARRRELLCFLVEETLHGRSDRLKGFTVAAAVFGRDESFDSSSDPVVRLEARRLRSDLDSYYVDAGRGDPVRITIPKGAYVPHFEWQGRASAPAAAPETAASAPALPAAGRPRGQLGWALVATALLVAAAGAGGAWSLLPPAVEARGPSLLVLPFSASSRKEDDRLFAMGMTQEVIAQMMRFAGIRLFSAPASFAQSPAADQGDLGERLGVTYVVQGSLQSGSDLVHVRVMLSDAASSEILWNGDYERPLSPGNIVAVQRRISSEIAMALGQPYGVLPAEEAKRLAPCDMSSYACVLRAYDYRRTFDETDFAPTVACLEAAVARDPDYADAWAMLGWLHLDAGRFDVAPDRDAAYALALKNAAHANAIDPDNVLALKALGSIYHYMGRFEESVAAMRKALHLNPNDPDAMAQLGWRLAVRGDFAEGIPYLQSAIDGTIDPPSWYFDLIAVDDYLNGDYAAMLANAQRSGVDGSGMGLSFVAIAQGALGSKREAEETLHKLAAVRPDFLDDPEAAYRVNQPTENLLRVLLDGLRKAGWEPATADDTSAR